MKISDLCNQIKKYSRKDLEWLTVELYEAVPKTKKEDIGIDEMITNPSYRKKKETKAFTLAIIQAEITKFIANAEAQHYLIPNREVPKSERSKWRFRVKQWYKDLQREKPPEADLAKQAELLTQLYHLLCKACGYQLFTAYDPFQSVGVEQTAFHETIYA